MPSTVSPPVPPPRPSYSPTSGGGEYESSSGYEGPPPSAHRLSELAPVSAVVEYDTGPVVGAAAPPPPPMSAGPPPPPAAPKVDLFSQIQAGKALRKANAEPDWVQILDTNSGAYYYEHKTTGESTWDAPASFVPAAGTGATSSSAASSGLGQGVAMENQLKNTLDRYRQFVQDEEDDVGECADEEWD